MRALTGILLLALSTPAAAQPEAFFGSGKPLIFREQETDRRFYKSRLNKLLVNGTDSDPCLQLVGAMLTVTAEIGPYLHKRDENFTVDPVLLQAFNAQVNTPRFPATAYLATMIRRVLIDGKLPAAWLDTAERINPTVRIIDLAKLRFMADGVQPIDSMYFTLAALKARHEIEVKRATSAAQNTAYLAFRDSYLDRVVTWGNFQLLDVGPEKRKGRKRAASGDAVVARLELIESRGSESELQIFMPKIKLPSITVMARLADRQYVDLYKFPKGKRVLVRGRLWDMNKNLTQFQIRDALIFEDRDWALGALLADPRAISQCPAAVNELTGVAPIQPGGFGQH